MRTFAISSLIHFFDFCYTQRTILKRAYDVNEVILSIFSIHFYTKSSDTSHMKALLNQFGNISAALLRDQLVVG